MYFITPITFGSKELTVVLYQLSYFRMACFSIASAKVYKKSESPNFSGLFCGIFVLKPGSAPFI